MSEDTNCGCGKPGRYTVFGPNREQTYSCNKYTRCPTYEELTEKVKELQSASITALNAILRNLNNVPHMDAISLVEAKEELQHAGVIDSDTISTTIRKAMSGKK